MVRTLLFHCQRTGSVSDKGTRILQAGQHGLEEGKGGISNDLTHCLYYLPHTACTSPSPDSNKILLMKPLATPLVLFFFFFLKAALCGIRDLSSLTRDRTHCCIESLES